LLLVTCRKKVLPFLETKKFIFETLDPNFRGAVFRYRSVIAYTNQYYKKNFTLEILDESLLTNEFVFYFAKNFYLKTCPNIMCSHSAVKKT
jgi:hypothetical protein